LDQDPCVRVISLASATARRQSFADLNSTVEFQFFDAVVGKTLDSQTTENREIFSEGLGYNAGCIGNALSHMLLWDHCQKSGKVLTVAEDDSIFRRDFSVARDAALEVAPADWDIIYWGVNFDAKVELQVLPGISPATLQFNQSALRQHTEAFRDLRMPAVLVPLAASCGLPSYSISPQGAARLLSICLPLNNVCKITGRQFANYGLDHAMGAACPHIRAFISLPPLVATKNLKVDSSANREIEAAL
jgi:glycosyl transferase family 25